MKYIIGIDEVGRGCLAGPITVAAFVATAHPRQISQLLHGIKDSKKLSPQQREEWYARLEGKTRFFAVSASVGPTTIDRVGITRSATIAVGRCLRSLKEKSKLGSLASKSTILLDGSLYAPRTYANQETIIKGDEKIPLIAAASIVAKVRRDRLMCRLHRKISQYQFDLHKGYGTAIHIHAIKKNGLSAVHRKSFCTKFS